MLARVFQFLAERKPDLDAGVYAYAKAGFGDYPGFLAAFGYWIGSCIGNVSYWVLIKATLGAFFPVFGDGNTVAAILVASIGIWLFHFMILKGVQQAAFINQVVTIAKIVPILVFIFILFFAFRADVFAENFWGGEGYADASLFDQVRATMLVTVFVFLGVEGASVYSRYAQRREHVGRATVLGFLAVLSVFASVTIVSYGILPRAELAQLRQPSMAEVLQAAVGDWGAVFISVGLIVSVLGAYLAWTLMAAEVLFVAAQDNDMPRFLRRVNTVEVPVAALLMSTLLIQALLFVTLLSEQAFDFALNMTSALTLIPFLLAAGYALKLAVTHDTYDERPEGRSRDLAVGALATLYTAFLLFAAGPKYMLVSFVLYAPASALFVMARREQGRRPFGPGELVILAVSIVGAVLGVVALVAGWITI
jgi:arginine:ornithine antiporter/lysine permease